MPAFPITNTSKKKRMRLLVGGHWTWEEGVLALSLLLIFIFIDKWLPKIKEKIKAYRERKNF